MVSMRDYAAASQMSPSVSAHGERDLSSVLWLMSHKAHAPLHRSSGSFSAFTEKEKTA